MKGTGLKDPICSFLSLCLWSLFEVKEASIQRKLLRELGQMSIRFCALQEGSLEWERQS